VKKHRKKTPSEHQGRSTDEINMDLSDEAFNPNDNMEKVERYREGSHECDIEDQMSEIWWDEKDDSIGDGEEPMILHISGNVDHGVIATKERLFEQNYLSNLDGEENDAIDQHERTQYDAERVPVSVAFKIGGLWIDVQPDVECGEGKGIDGNSLASKDEADSERMIDNAVYNSNPMVSSMTTGLRHDVEEKISTVSEIMHYSDDNLEMKERIKAEVSPVLGTPDKPSNSEYESKLGSSPKSPIDANLGEASDPPDIPSLSAAETPSTNYLSPRALSPQPVFVDLTTEPIISGLLSMPDLSDEDSDDGDARRTGIRSLFRGTKDDKSEIRACGSDVTEVTSNVDGKEIGGWTVDFLRATPARGGDVSGPSVYFQLNAVDCLGEESVIPLEKSESCTSTDRSHSSTVSYYSYEDVSIASEESEMCAICLCAYEEGDVRIFSKRCPHGELHVCWIVPR
jgi:hypothetical protein